MGHERYKLRVNGIIFCIFFGEVIKVGGVRHCLVWRGDRSSSFMFCIFFATDSSRAHQYPWHLFDDFPLANTIACISRSSNFSSRRQTSLATPPPQDSMSRSYIRTDCVHYSLHSTRVLTWGALRIGLPIFSFQSHFALNCQRVCTISIYVVANQSGHQLKWHRLLLRILLNQNLVEAF